MHPPDNKGIKLTAKIVNEYAARYKRWICRKEPGGGGHLGHDDPQALDTCTTVI